MDQIITPQAHLHYCFYSSENPIYSELLRWLIVTQAGKIRTCLRADERGTYSICKTACVSDTAYCTHKVLQNVTLKAVAQVVEHGIVS